MALLWCLEDIEYSSLYANQQLVTETVTYTIFSIISHFNYNFVLRDLITRRVAIDDSGNFGKGLCTPEVHRWLRDEAKCKYEGKRVINL